MDETNKGQGDAPRAAGQPSADQGGTTPATKTYTEADYQKAVSDALAKAGRERKSVEEENKTLKSQISVIEEVKSQLSAAKADLEVLAKDDPDKQKLLQTRKALEDQLKSLNADKEKLEEEKTKHADALRAAGRILVRDNVAKIVTDYEGGDAEKLRTITEQFGILDEDKIRSLADAMWSKKKTEPAKTEPESAVIPDSGVTSGGNSGTFTRTQIKNMSSEEYKAKYNEIQEALRSGRIIDR
ncbi:MAG: hypothetical protein PHV11_03840 [Candidatus Bipolaricaulis sp.]|nr:hypothetical protein [Candidatus Bipolaricaulis sp.]